MIKQYFLQALSQLRQQPLISLVTVAGTALSILLIMLVVMIQQVQVEPFAPESNRDRMLHVKWQSLSNEEWGDGTSNGPWSASALHEVYGGLTTAEAVTIYSVWTAPMPVSLPGQPARSVDARATDATFWHVFDFAFVDGKPYTEADVRSGLPVVLWIVLVLALLGLHVYSMAIYLLYASVSLAIQLGMGSMSLINKVNVQLNKEGGTAALTSVLLALAAPLMLVLAVCSIGLWVITLPGGFYILQDYVLQGVDVGSTRFNVVQVLLIFSMFFITRRA